MQAVFALAQRTLRTANCTAFPSPGLSTANFDTYKAALLIAASRQQCSALTNSVTSVFASRRFSQAAVAEQSQADIQLTEAAVERLQELNQQECNSVLRLRVDAGGCSGFSYVFDLEKNPPPDDIVVHQKGVQLVTDTVSYELLRGAVVDYTTDLIRASFEVTQNPNASGKCGCGASFEPKM
ncbi:hypothetical protein ABBQ38_014328 [Trebouxia sp. C0009 RCD-2024]